jgi:hypothetical protein
VGRPRTRWTDVVLRDALHLLGIREWRRRAENRDDWRRFMRRPRDVRSCSAPYMDGLMDVTQKTAQPIRDESYRHLPSKTIMDEVDKISKISTAMSSNRSEVKPSECENVAKKAI